MNFINKKRLSRSGKRFADRLRARLSSRSFKCECCGLTFDRQRQNCPACGCMVREPNAE